MKNKFNKKNKNNIDPFVIQEGKYKKIEGYSYRTSWAENSYAEERGIGEIVGNSFDIGKIRYIIFFIFVFLFLIYFRIIWLQVVKGDYYYSMAEGNRIRIERIEAKRGVIYDKNMNPLVRNVANFLLYFIPSDLPRDLN